MAKDINIGDILFTASMDNNILKLGTSPVKNIKVTETNTMLYFNKNNSVKFTPTEDLIIVKNGQYKNISADKVSVGDSILSNSHGNMCELIVESIHFDNTETRAYNFGPIGIIFTQSVLVDHTK